jgi:hypothetical protein
MKEPEDLCVVCGDPSAALICAECQRLIGAKPLRTTPPRASAPARPLSGVQTAD